MSAQKAGFFYGIGYRILIIALFLMFALGVTCSIWQFVSARNNNGVSSVFGYMSVDIDGQNFYTFSRCSVEDLKENDIILYDYANESGVTTMSIGQFVQFIEDGDFGNIVVNDTIHGTVETRPASMLMGKKTNADHFSYALIGLFNSSIMLYLFTITPFVLILILALSRKYVDSHDAKPRRK